MWLVREVGEAEYAITTRGYSRVMTFNHIHLFKIYLNTLVGHNGTKKHHISKQKLGFTKFDKE